MWFSTSVCKGKILKLEGAVKQGSMNYVRSEENVLQCNFSTILLMKLILRSDLAGRRYRIGGGSWYSWWLSRGTLTSLRKGLTGTSWSSAIRSAKSYLCRGIIPGARTGWDKPAVKQLCRMRWSFHSAQPWWDTADMLSPVLDSPLWEDMDILEQVQWGAVRVVKASKHLI